ncbi:MAG: 50S ribosomal protein L32 [Candidatus Magasanikbacteria bacterium]|jgi:large subunit ribosomal protein L32
MGLPGHRRTSSDKRKRSAHFGLKEINSVSCPKCGQANVSHRVCAFCGTYKGRQVLNLDRRAARAHRAAKKKK